MRDTGDKVWTNPLAYPINYIQVKDILLGIPGFSGCHVGKTSEKAVRTICRRAFHSIRVPSIRLEERKLFVAVGRKGGDMRIGDIVHLDGLKAEYSLYGKDRFTTCTLPDGNYIIVGIEESYIKLAWSDIRGIPSKKHRYRIQLTAFGGLHEA